MKIIVQKFGGTSVRDEWCRKEAIKHIQKAVDEGYKVVVVVSAMGRIGDNYATDTLLALVNGSNSKVSNRELDMIMSCGEVISAVVMSSDLNLAGISACSLNGGQAGFITTEDFTNAKVIEMNVERLTAELNEHDVVVVTGFQGVSPSGDVTTIGRGGSDTSATALGVALEAEYVDIFTDVEGIMTADPRISKNASQISHITYNEVCNLAHQGAKVIHPRAVEIAMLGNIPIRIRSTYSDDTGTLVTAKKQESISKLSDKIVTGIAHVSGISQIKVSAKEHDYNLQSDVFNAMAEAEISVDFINIYPNGVQYTVDGSDVERAVTSLRNMNYETKVVNNCAKVSVIGAGISGVSGVTAKIVTPLVERGIQILQSADSFTTIWILVNEKNLVEAVNALHEAFGLGKK